MLWKPKKPYICNITKLLIMDNFSYCSPTRYVSAEVWRKKPDGSLPPWVAAKC